MSKKELREAMVVAKNALNDMFVEIDVHNARHDDKIEGPVVTALRDASIGLRNALEKDAAKQTITKLSADDPVSILMEGVIGCVEANSFEKVCLWEFNRISISKREWKEENSGYLVTIGYIDGSPVAISLNTATIDRQKILFYYPTSVMVDYDMIREWLSVNLPDTAKGNYPGGYNSTDAQNFHNVFRG